MSDVKRGQAARVSTGIKGLDDILGGGLIADRLYLVDGDPGSGKTTLGLKFLLQGVEENESCLYVTLSETKHELAAVAESHGWSLDKIHVFELQAHESKMSGLEEQYTFFHPSEVELGQTTKSVLSEVERVEPRRVVFDSLSEMRLLARDALRYRRQILGLKQFFVDRDCTLLLLDDRTSDSGDLQLQSLAHGAITLEQLAPEYGAERRRLRVIKFRGAKYRGGFHDFVIGKGGLQVFPRLVAAEHTVPFKDCPARSDLEGLDALLGGGLQYGSSTLIMGPAGAGKSSIATSYMVAALKRGEKAAMYIFDEGMGSLFQRSSGLGMDLKPYVDGGLLQLHQVDPAELSPGEFVANIRQNVEVDGIRFLVIDSLNGYLNAMPEERFLLIQMHELLTYLNQCGIVSLILMAQHGLVGNMENVVDISYLADTVMLLRYFESCGEVRRALSVVKKRSGYHENTIREINFGAGGIKLGEPLRGFQGILTGVPKKVEDTL